MKVFAIIIFGLAVFEGLVGIVRVAEKENKKENKSLLGITGAFISCGLTTWVYIWWLTTLFN